MFLDVIVIVFFILMMIYGYKKGCISIVARLASLLIAFVLAYFLAGTVGGYIKDTNIGVNINDAIENTINSTDTVITIVSNIQTKLGIESEEQLINNISNYTFIGIGFVIVFVIARIILWIVQKILESIFDLPILKTFNKLGGVVLSAIMFIIELSIILAVISSLSTFSFMSGVLNIIHSSTITKLLYEQNIFTNIILHIRI